jgi:GNAT superfamily N-acetyltransferase
MREDRTAFEPEAPPRAGAPAPPPELAIGEATAQDVAGCVALAGLVADGTIAYGRTAWFEPDAEAPANAAPAGYYLVGLVVDPSWRRRGVASAITATRLAWVAQRASEAWYFADRSDLVSIRLHEQAGFTTVTDDFWFPTVTDGDGSHLLGRAQLSAG